MLDEQKDFYDKLNKMTTGTIGDKENPILIDEEEEGLLSNMLEEEKFEDCINDKATTTKQSDYLADLEKNDKQS